MNVVNFGIRRLVSVGISFSFIGMLSGCGGGGGGDSVASSTPSTTEFPLSTAIANFVNQTRSYQFIMNGTGLSSGQTISFTGAGTVSESMVQATFEGTAAFKKSVTNTGTLTMLGTTIPVAITASTYFDSNYVPIGSSVQNAYCITSAKNQLPAKARIGDNGNWYTLTCYTNSSKSQVDSIAYVSYSIEPDSATTALFKLITTINGSPTSQTIRVNTSGSVTRISESGFLNISGVALTYTGTYL